jgi:hypothetical protein
MEGVTNRLLVIALVATGFAGMLRAAQAGVLLGGNGLAGGYRWDAAPRTVNDNERSLDGGLRYSLQGGSFEAYRDLLHWSQLPSVEDFQLAFEQAFAAWTSVDPATGLHTNVSFVPDLSTPVVGSNDFNGHDSDGAEIDLLALDGGITQVRAQTGFAAVGVPVTLTTGATNYPQSFAITGIDITMNNNAGAVISSLDSFRRLLTHEIGHALGIGDVEFADDAAVFIDDNYDGSTSESARATLNNSWALKVDPFDPAASPLNTFLVADGDPGIKSPGVNLLMESNGLGISSPGNPVSNLVPLTNDEFAMRQFLYPSLERDVVVTGDYNGDGVVDAADYTVWRDTFGQTVFWEGDGADGDQSGMIDQGDYEFWKQHYGDVIAAPMGLGSAVPEPTSAWLAILSIAAIGVRCARRS